MGAVVIGGALAPSMLAITKNITNVLMGISGFISRHQAMVAAVATGFLTLTAAGVALRSLSFSFLAVKAAVIVAQGAMALFTTATTIASTAWTGLAAIIAAPIAPLVLLGAVVVSIGAYFLYTSGLAGKAATFIKERFAGVVGYLTGLWNKIRTDAGTALAGIKDSLVAGDFMNAIKILAVEMQIVFKQLSGNIWVPLVTSFQNAIDTMAMEWVTFGILVGKLDEKTAADYFDKRAKDRAAALKAASGQGDVTDLEKQLAELRKKAGTERAATTAGGGTLGDAGNGATGGRSPSGTFNPGAAFGLGGGVLDRIAEYTKQTAQNTGRNVNTPEGRAAAKAAFEGKNQAARDARKAKEDAQKQKDDAYRAAHPLVHAPAFDPNSGYGKANRGLNTLEGNALDAKLGPDGLYHGKGGLTLTPEQYANLGKAAVERQRPIDYGSLHRNRVADNNARADAAEKARAAAKRASDMQKAIEQKRITDMEIEEANRLPGETKEEHLKRRQREIDRDANQSAYDRLFPKPSVSLGKSLSGINGATASAANAGTGQMEELLTGIKSGIDKLAGKRGIAFS
jgi:hypothetical protein